ncbi:MAG: TolC family protein [Bacteroidales bacterium]|nr:TolC family protein [Bacteroidales bacterium]
MLKYLISILTCFIVHKSFSQQWWGYSQCAQYAIENNLTLKQEQLKTENQLINYKMAVNKFLPNLNANTGYSITQGKTVDPNTNDVIDNQSFFSNSYSLGADLDIFSGFNRKSRVLFEKHNLKASQSNLAMQQNTITYNVLQAYTSVLLYQGLIEIQQQHLALSQQEFNRTIKLIEIGQMAGVEIHEASSILAMDEFQLTRYKNLAEDNLAKLKRLMYYPCDSSLSITPIGQQNKNFNEVETGSIFNYALENLPLVKRVNYLLDASENQLRMQQAGYWPSLAFFVGWQTGYFETSKLGDGTVTPFRDQMDQNMQFGYGFNLSIPIFSRFGNRNKVQQAKINIQHAELEREQALLQLEYDIAEAMRNWKASIEENELAKKQEISAASAFEAAQKRKEKGLISAFGYYHAKQNLAAAQGESLRTNLQLFMMEKTIWYYLTGTLLGN